MHVTCALVLMEIEKVLDFIEMGERQIYNVGAGTELGSLARGVLSAFNS